MCHANKSSSKPQPLANNTMKRVFISDVHLSEERRDLTEAFCKFIDQQRDIDELYLLGDIFEAWVGDDDYSEWLLPIEAALTSLASRGIALFFLHGNRDFLIGREWCDKIGITLLTEPTTIEIAGETWLLTHGDELCTDDVEYQEFRQLSRSHAWQSQLLSQPIEARFALARQLRDQSKMANANKAENIMDVNQDAVVKALRSSGASALLHGHTHRPHDHNESGFRRVVLGDWRPEYEYAVANDADGLRLVSSSD